MPSESTLDEYRAVQQAAKQVLSDLTSTIGPDDTELSIAQRASAGLRNHGLPETWYYSCQAFVLLGSRSCLSISGRDYHPACELVGSTNLITVDLSPKRGTVWGDCARSFFIEAAHCAVNPVTPEFSVGKLFVESLHAAMVQFVKHDTTFHQLFEWTNAMIAAAQFENLDYLGNVGHSIATRREDRRYIKDGNHSKLSEVPFFTFEPHVRTSGGSWGFKHENIFFFNNCGTVEEL